MRSRDFQGNSSSRCNQALVKSNNDQPICLLASGCVKEDGRYCLLFRGDGIVSVGTDLGTVVFYHRVTEDDPGSWAVVLEPGDDHPTWAIVTTITDVNEQQPIHSAMGVSCDGTLNSAFPSVNGEENYVLLLSQSFDDNASRIQFMPPNGTILLGQTTSSDEVSVDVLLCFIFYHAVRIIDGSLLTITQRGFLFGERLRRSGPTGELITGGLGGSKCKDSLLSVVVNRGDPKFGSNGSISKFKPSFLPLLGIIVIVSGFCMTNIFT